MGVSTETGLPQELNGSSLWTYDIQGGGIPVVAGNKVYQFGYYGSGKRWRKVWTCLILKAVN